MHRLKNVRSKLPKSTPGICSPQTVVEDRIRVQHGEIVGQAADDSLHAPIVNVHSVLHSDPIIRSRLARVPIPALTISVLANQFMELARNMGCPVLELNIRIGKIAFISLIEEIRLKPVARISIAVQ